MKLRIPSIIVLLTVVACGSSSNGNDAATACASACGHSATLCGLEAAPKQCSRLCEILGKYSPSQFECIQSATSCDDAQRCIARLDGGPGGLGRIGQKDPSGCAPYFCLCADGKMSCGTIGDSTSTCLDPTESICRPSCEDYGGLVRIGPSTNMLCSTSL